MPQDTTQRGYYTHLCGIMLKTSRARFFAAKNLKAKDHASLVVSVLLSISLISISISQLAGLPAILRANTGITILAVIAAIGLLAQTLIDWALARSVLAAKLHDNALQITRTLREMERELAKPEPDFSILSSLAARYEDMNVLTGVNHSDIDYKLSRTDVALKWQALELLRQFKNATIRGMIIAFSSLLGTLSLSLVVGGGLYFLVLHQ